MKKPRSPITFIMLHKESMEADQEKSLKTAWIKFNRKHTRKNHQRNKGFSLIELLVTVGIIGILASVAIPAYNTYRQNAAEGAAEAEAQNMMKAFQSCLASGETIANCGSNNINGVLGTACTAASASTLKAGATGFTANGCRFVRKAATGRTCYLALKITGGFGAAHCIDYNPATGTLTEKSGTGTFGGAVVVGSSCTAAGVCQ